MTHIASKLEFVTLDELEAGFADRLGVDAVFLPRSLLGVAQDVLYVGAAVLVDITTAQGEKALSFEGFVAWSYPAAPRTPPGREPGTGIIIERMIDAESEQRVARMRRRPGAGGRVRVPGSRLPVLRLPAPGKPAERASGAMRAAPGSPPTPASTASFSSSSSSSPSSSTSSSPARARDDRDRDLDVTAPVRAASRDPSTREGSSREGSGPTRAVRPPATEVSGPLVAPPLPATLLPANLLAQPKTPPPVEEHTQPYAASPGVAPARAAPQAPEARQGSTSSLDLEALPPPLAAGGDGVADVSVDETGEIVVSHPPAPQPRLMAMGLLVDQSFDPTPAPQPSPLLPEGADTLPPQDGSDGTEPSLDRPVSSLSSSSSMSPSSLPPSSLPPSSSSPHGEAVHASMASLPSASLPSASSLPDASAPASPGVFSAGPPTLDGVAPETPRAISIEGLPDAAATAPPPGAFEQRQTDVDLLVSLDDADFFPAELEEQRARARKLASQLSAVSQPPSPPIQPTSQPNSALLEQTVMSLDDLPSAEADAELPEVDADDVEALPNVLPAPEGMLAPPQTGDVDASLLAGIAGVNEALVHDTNDAHDPSEEVAAPVTAMSQESLVEVSAESAPDAAATAARDYSQGEHTAITAMPAPKAGSWEARTEHGATDPPTAEGQPSTTEATSSDAENLALQSTLPPRALPEPEPFPDSPGIFPGIIGAAFLVSHKRGPDVIHAVEPFTWPKNGTKRWNALDQAREDGDDLDIAIAHSPWLARDPSAPPPESFEQGLTDPGVNVADVVGKALQLADEEGDSVFSDAPAPVRPAMRRPGDEGGENEETADGLSPAAAASRLHDDSEEIETDRDMKRPPSKASAEATARLGVLQKFLGRR